MAVIFVLSYSLGLSSVGHLQALAVKGVIAVGFIAGSSEVIRAPKV